MPADTLSQVLRTVQLTGSLFFRVRVRAPYAVTTLGVREMIERYAPGVQHMLPFHLVTRGSMWVDVPGHPSVHLREDDIIVLPRGADHSITDRPGTTPTPVVELERAIAGDPPTLEWGGEGARAEALCGFVHCNGRIFNPLVDALPEVLVIRGDSERASWLTAALRRTFDETLRERPGRDAMVAHLAELLFLEVIQRYVEEGGGEGDGTGWLGALRDPVVGEALARLHARPEYAWTLDALAREVGASRTVLAERFAAAVGVAPIHYLAAWRMELAAQRLEETTDPVADIAEAVGYGSTAAFNRAFKQHTGVPPAAWRARLHADGTPSA